jgi:Zn-dependent protease
MNFFKKTKSFILNPDTSLSVGKIFGISIDIHLSWLVIFGLLMYSLSTTYYVNYTSRFIAWFFGFFSTILLFASVTAHELTHSFFALKSGVNVRRILLFMFGGVANITSEPPKPSAEVKIAISGPICSYTISAFSLLIFYLISFKPIQKYGFWQIVDLSLTRQISQLLGNWAPFAGLFFYIALVNFILGTFNLIPAFPMDGGRVLRALIWKITGSFVKATQISSIISRIIAFSIGVLGSYLILNKYFFVGIWNIIIALFLYRAALRSYKRILYNNRA